MAETEAQALLAELTVHGAPAVGTAGKPGRVLVLLVEAEPFEPIPDNADPTAVFVGIGGIDPHPGMEAFVAGVDHDRVTWLDEARREPADALLLGTMQCELRRDRGGRYPGATLV